MSENKAKLYKYSNLKKWIEQNLDEFCHNMNKEKKNQSHNFLLSFISVNIGYLQKVLDLEYIVKEQEKIMHRSKFINK